MQDIDNLPASEARRRLEAYRKRQQAAAAAKAAAEAGQEAAEAAAAARVAFEGSISDAFEGALRFYVSEEQREVGSSSQVSPEHQQWQHQPCPVGRLFNEVICQF